MFVVNHQSISLMVHAIGMQKFMLDLVDRVLQSYVHWDEYDHQPRQACYYPQGVIELMPSSDHQWHGVKWINCHPENVKLGLPTIVGLGVWSSVSDGMPQMICDMTLLTAFRTAAATGVFLKYAQKRLLQNIMIIGLGAQSDFHALMLSVLFPNVKLFVYDIDLKAIEKFMKNTATMAIQVHVIDSVEMFVNQVDAVITLTAAKKKTAILESKWIKKPLVIAAVGGDSPGKTEIDPALIERSHVVVQFLEQTEKEGEIQNAKALKIHHLYQAVKSPIEELECPLIFDSVGFAIEDHAVMRYIWQMVQNYPQLVMKFFPDLHQQPKDLWQSIGWGGCE
jgi:ornithine cyclodeaminase